MSTEYRKIVMLAERYSDQYEDISIQRQGWVGRNKATGATEVLPVNAFDIIPLDQVLLPEVERMVYKLFQELVGDVKEEEDAEDPGEPQAEV